MKMNIGSRTQNWWWMFVTLICNFANFAYSLQCGYHKYARLTHKHHNDNKLWFFFLYFVWCVCVAVGCCCSFFDFGRWRMVFAFIFFSLAHFYFEFWNRFHRFTITSKFMVVGCFVFHTKLQNYLSIFCGKHFILFNLPFRWLLCPEWIKSFYRSDQHSPNAYCSMYLFTYFVAIPVAQYKNENTNNGQTSLPPSTITQNHHHRVCFHCYSFSIFYRRAAIVHCVCKSYSVISQFTHIQSICICIHIQQ